MKTKLPLFLIAAAMLASCGGGNTPTSEPSTDPASDTSAAPQGDVYLDWVAKNKVVIELFNAGDARFTYGNAALSQASNMLDLNDSADLACSSTLTADQVVNFVYVTETADGTSSGGAAALFAGIKGDSISGFLNDNDNLKGKVKGYVAISFGETVTWTKGKNAAMDAKIQSLVDVAKN